MTTRVTLQPAFVLHTRAFRDTSLLVELFSLQHGRITVVARGVRSSKSKLRGLLLPLVPLLVSWSGKSELMSLGKVEANGPSYNLFGSALLSSIYLNELLMRLLHRHDPHPGLFNAYQSALINLQQGSAIQPVLRIFEKQLLAEIGYGLELDRTADGQQIWLNLDYSYQYQRGFMPTSQVGGFNGANLLAFHHNQLTTPAQLSTAKRLTRQVLQYILGDRPLKSRELFN